MTRRISVAIVGVVALSLVLAGLGTLALTRRQDRRITEEQLRDQAQVVATFVEAIPATGAIEAPLRIRLERVRNQLELNDVTVLVLRGETVVDGDLPAGMAGELDMDQLLRTGATSGASGRLVFAAAVADLPGPLSTVVVLTSDADPVVGPVVRWFLLAALVALASAVLVAWLVGRRLARPLREAGDVAHRIAAGDLAARVPTDGGTDELAEMAGAMNTMAESLERSRGLEQRFLLSVSHDLRTPLTSIRGYAEAIADGTVPDPASAAEVVLAESRRLERLVADLLDLARLDARTFGFSLRTLDLGVLASDVAAGFAQELSSLGLALVTEGPADPLPVVADPDRLAQVVANLVENATKFATSRVEVGWQPVDGGGVVWVADDGPGIAPDDRPHVFERLYVTRLRPRRKEAGSGLGLAIVKELVDGMGARVDVRARDGAGTVFSVQVPGAPTAPGAPGRAPMSDRQQPPPAHPPDPPTA